MKKSIHSILLTALLATAGAVSAQTTPAADPSPAAPFAVTPEAKSKAETGKKTMETNGDAKSNAATANRKEMRNERRANAKPKKNSAKNAGATPLANPAGTEKTP